MRANPPVRWYYDRTSYGEFTILYRIVSVFLIACYGALVVLKSVLYYAEMGLASTRHIRLKWRPFNTRQHKYTIKSTSPMTQMR